MTEYIDGFIADGGTAGAGHHDRRDILKKAGIGAAVAWTAPAILSMATPAAAASAAGNCPGCGVNTIVNGSFETGLAPWVGGGANAGAYPYTVFGGAIHAGPGAGLQFGGGLLGDSLTQTFPVDAACAGSSFALSFDHVVVGQETITVTFIGSASPPVTQVNNDIGGYNPPTQPFANMTPGSVSGTIPAGTTAVSVSFAGTGNNPAAAFNLFGADLVTFLIGC